MLLKAYAWIAAVGKVPTPNHTSPSSDPILSWTRFPYVFPS